MLTLSLRTPQELSASYMPFIKNGGIFIKTMTEFSLGDKIALHLQLPDQENAIVVNTQVVWITPIGAQAGKPAGVGVQFLDDEGTLVKTTIEKLLEQQTDSSVTYTF